MEEHIYKFASVWSANRTLEAHHRRFIRVLATYTQGGEAVRTVLVITDATRSGIPGCISGTKKPPSNPEERRLIFGIA